MTPRENYVIDLFCGLGGWTAGFLAQGFDVIGFDIQRFPYPGQFVLQDVLTLDGARFKNAAMIVASPPCQNYSFMAMPFKRSKAMEARWKAEGADNRLFDACFRIQREASEAAGHYIPMVVENVRGAQKWVGRAKWHFGSFYLWGDIPALMPTVASGNRGEKAGDRNIGRKNGEHKWSVSFLDHLKLPVNNSPRRWQDRDVSRRGDEGIKQGGDWFRGPNSLQRFGSKTSKRKLASAMLAKIPFRLAHHIAWVARNRIDNGL